MTPLATRVPDTATLASLHGRSMLLTTDWSVPQIEALLDVARRFEELDRAGRLPALLPDQLAYALFFDHSTRTKSAGSRPTWAKAISTHWRTECCTPVPIT